MGRMTSRSSGDSSFNLCAATSVLAAPAPCYTVLSESYHNFEIASAALEIGIVLASATIITGITVLAWIAGTLGVVGLAFMGIALIAPHTVHVL